MSVYWNRKLLTASPEHRNDAYFNSDVHVPNDSLSENHPIFRNLLSVSNPVIVICVGQNVHQGLARSQRASQGQTRKTRALGFVYVKAKCLLFLPTAIGNAYAVLSNPEKRQQYDQYGDQSTTLNAPQQSSHSRHGHHRSFHRDFEADISPEELFNIFFGGRFPTGMLEEVICSKAGILRQ